MIGELLAAPVKMTKWNWLALILVVGFAAISTFTVQEFAWPTRVIAFLWLMVPIGAAFYLKARREK